MRHQLHNLVSVLTFLIACSSSNPPPPSGTATIGAGGGTVTSSDGQVSLAIPAGALSSDTTISIQPFTTPSEASLVPGTTYTLSPDGTEFAKPVTATFRYDTTKLPSGADEHTLQVTKLQSDGQRLASTSTVDTAAHTVAGQLTGFSPWGLICCQPPKTPTNFAGSFDATTGTVRLTWNLVLVNNLSPTSELRIERAEALLPVDSDFHPLATLPNTDSAFSGSGFVDSDNSTFHPTLTVWYRIRGATGTYVDAPVITLVVIPSLTVTATAQSSTSILLSWNNIVNAVDYKVERSSGGAPFAVVTTLPNTMLQFTDTGLSPQTQYDYRVTVDLPGSATAVATASAATSAGATSYVYVTDRTRIIQMTNIAGDGWTALSGKSDGSDHFSHAWGIAADALGAIYVTDGPRLVKTNITGTSWQVLTGNAAGTDSFFNLEGIAVDGAGNIYVSDWGGTGQRARIVKTTIDGATWTPLGTSGSGVNQFGCPGMIYVDASHIYVADRCNGRITRMNDITGAGWITLSARDGGGDSFATPRGVSLDSAGAIYVADEQGNRVVQTTMSGDPWISVLVGFSPSTIAVDGPGSYYVGSYFGDYLSHFSAAGRTDFTTEPHGDTFSAVFGVSFVQ